MTVTTPTVDSSPGLKRLPALLYAAIGIASLVLPAGGALLALALARVWPGIDLAPAHQPTPKGYT